MGSEMCIRDRLYPHEWVDSPTPAPLALGKYCQQHGDYITNMNLNTLLSGKARYKYAHPRTIPPFPQRIGASSPTAPVPVSLVNIPSPSQDDPPLMSFPDQALGLSPPESPRLSPGDTSPSIPATELLYNLGQMAKACSLRSLLPHPETEDHPMDCLLYTSPSPRDLSTSRMPSSA